MYLIAKTTGHLIKDFPY